MKRAIVTVCLGIMLLAVYTPVQADWIGETLDDVVTNYTGPQYVEGQNRNYLAFGNVSFRQVMTKDNLFSINVPRVRAGCGGIDIFGGGVGFMDFDLLVDKLQNIIQAAPAFAFIYAIKSISQEIGLDMQWLENTIDLLNQVQLDECAMSRAIATYAVDSLSPWSSKAKADANSEFLTRARMALGMDDLYHSALSFFESKNNQPDVADVQNVNQDCPALFQHIFVDHDSLLDYIFDTYSATLPSEMEALMRGYLGDVIFELTAPGNANSQLNTILLEPCGGANSFTFESLVHGLAQENPGFTTNSCQNWTGTNLYDRIATAVTNIFNALQGGGALNANDVALLNTIPFPIMDHIKNCYALDAPSLIQQLTPAAAYGYGHVILNNILHETDKVIMKLEKDIADNCKESHGADNLCGICEDPDITVNLKEIRKRVHTLLRESDAQYLAKLQEATSTVQIAEILRETKFKTLAHLLTQNKK